MISEALEVADKGEYEHFMLKEIYEQPQALRATLGNVPARLSFWTRPLAKGSGDF